MRRTMLAPTVLLGSRECAHLPLPRLEPTTTVERMQPRPFTPERESASDRETHAPRAPAAA